MSDFIQMDIFFFIASVAAVVLLIIVTVVGTYAYLFVKRVFSIISMVDDFLRDMTIQGKDTLTSIKERMEELISTGGVTERLVATALGTIIAKTFKGRGKIKGDAPNR